MQRFLHSASSSALRRGTALTATATAPIRNIRNAIRATPSISSSATPRSVVSVVSRPLPFVVGGVRSLTSSSARLLESDSATSFASPLTPSRNAGANEEIKMQAYYLGADAFNTISLSAHQASGAYRFTQPNSVLIPLDAAPEDAAANAGEKQTLAQLFSLPPLPVAPIVRIPSASATPASSTTALPSSASLSFDAQRPYMIAFSYGAVVFMNATEAQQQQLLRGKTDSAKLKDDYRILLRSNTESSNFACRFLTDAVEVSEMDLNAFRIFSQILSQTVAMQHYESEAHRLLLKLRAMLRPNELHKSVPTLGHHRADLIVQYVAESSTAMVDVLTELKLLDRSEIVWGSGQYDPLWMGLRREFDLTDRWEALQTKLDLLRDSHPFFLQVIHTMQSHRMEIIIILLIAMEVVLSVVFHSPLVPWVKEQLGLAEPEVIEAATKAVKSKGH